MSTYNRVFLWVFSLLGTAALYVAIFQSAYHQYFLAAICIGMILVIRNDNKRE